MYLAVGIITFNVLIGFFVEGGGQDHCPDIKAPSEQLFVVGDTCYNYIEAPSLKVSYDAAEADCRSRRGILLTLQDEMTSTKVETEIQYRVDSHTILLGLRNIGGVWKWATGDSMSFSKFGEQPASSADTCAKLKLMEKSVWEKVPCGATDWFSTYICEHNERTKSLTAGSGKLGGRFESALAVLISALLMFILH